MEIYQASNYKRNVYQIPSSTLGMLFYDKSIPPSRFGRLSLRSLSSLPLEVQGCGSFAWLRAVPRLVGHFPPPAQHFSEDSECHVYHQLSDKDARCLREGRRLLY